MTTALQKSTAPRKYLSYQFYLRISWNLVWDAGPNPEIEIPFMISNPEDFQIRNHDHQVKPGDMITKAAWVWRGVTQILPSAPQRKNKYRLGGWNMSSLKKQSKIMFLFLNLIVPPNITDDFPGVFLTLVTSRPQSSWNCLSNRCWSLVIFPARSAIAASHGLRAMGVKPRKWGIQWRGRPLSI